MNFAICINCGTKFSTKFRKGVQRYCTDKCKLEYRAKMKKLPPKLRFNVVPCPDCGEPMSLEKVGNTKFLRLACNNKTCELMWVTGTRVLRSGLSKKRSTPSEVPYLINMLRLPEELYNSIRIIDYYTMAQLQHVEPVVKHWKRHYLTPVQETNLLCTLVDQVGFDLEKHEILIPVITWGERRLNLMRKEGKIPAAFLCEAGVKIATLHEDVMQDGSVILMFDKAVRALGLTKGERVQLAALLLEDIDAEATLDKSRVRRVLGVRNTVPSKTCTS